MGTAAGTSFFGSAVERRAPRAVRVLRRLRTLDLAPRQREIAYEMAVGWSHSTVRDRLGLTMHA